MPAATPIGPDLVICGAARAGTSFLASLLGQHPAVDSGAVKEPNYFSREFGRSPEWYDGLFDPRQDGRYRLDASMSYTFQHFPDALANLAKSAPDAFVIYSVREPLSRLLSHYQLHRDYFRNEPAETLGKALAGTNVYRGASDYAHWLTRVQDLFPQDRRLVVPFDIVTGRTTELVDLVCGNFDIDPGLIQVENSGSHQYRNEVVEFRSEMFRKGRRVLRRAGAYPWLRRKIGNDRLRNLRTRMTRRVQVENLAAALRSCDRTQLLGLQELYTSSQTAVATALEEQDGRLGLCWAKAWAASSPAHGSVDVREALGTRH